MLIQAPVSTMAPPMKTPAAVPSGPKALPAAPRPMAGALNPRLDATSTEKPLASLNAAPIVDHAPFARPMPSKYRFTDGLRRSCLARMARLAAAAACAFSQRLLPRAASRCAHDDCSPMRPSLPASTLSVIHDRSGLKLAMA